MITEISVDGFRSLRNFNLPLKRGLNILVGPNGAGKTNIIAFFQVLAWLMEHSIGESISMAGGPAAVFAKTGNSQFSQEITCEIIGKSRGFESYGPGEKKKEIKYIYRFCICATPQLESVYFKHQEIIIWSLDKYDGKEDLLTSLKTGEDADLHIIQHSDETGSTKGEVRFWSRDRVKSRRVISEEKNKKDLETMSNAVSSEMSPDASLLLSAPFYFPIIRVVASDLRGGETLNILPSQARNGENSAKPPGIQSDGSGLSATLFHLKRSSENQRPVSNYRLFMSWPASRFEEDAKKIFEQIVSLAQIVNPDISDILVDNDINYNQLRITVNLFGGSHNVPLPMAAMSDGTVKWLALVTAILTSGSIFAIEEPENFLHPLMQKEIVRIMREDAERREEAAFVIMTTHSETLLNAADPDEVIVVALRDGVTRAHRPEQLELLRKEISETGFGLGFYYLAGALDNA